MHNKLSSADVEAYKKDFGEQEQTHLRRSWGRTRPPRPSKPGPGRTGIWRSCGPECRRGRDTASATNEQRQIGKESESLARVFLR